MNVPSPLPLSGSLPHPSASRVRFGAGNASPSAAPASPSAAPASPPATPTPPENASSTPADSTQPPKKLGFFASMKALYQYATHADNRKVFVGLAQQYGPDIGLPLIFSIPVVGWIAGLVAMPFANHFSKQGEAYVAEQRKHLTKDNPLRHALKMDDIWNEKWKDLKPNESPQWDKYRQRNADQIAEKMAKQFNKLLQKLFKEGSQGELLRNRFTIDYEKNSLAFRALKRLVNARKALSASWLFKWPLKATQWLFSKFPFIPRPLQMLLKLPAFALIGIYFLFGVRDKTPPAAAK